MDNSWNSMGANNPGANSGATRDQYADLVRLQVSGKRLITEDRENALLQDGVMRFGLSLEEARGRVRSAAEDRRVVLQRDIDESASFLLRDSADRKGRLKRKDFDRVARFYKLRADGMLSEPEVRQRVKSIMQQQNFTPRRAGFIWTRRWYNKI
jgi:hypothetical protein